MLGIGEDHLVEIVGQAPDVVRMGVRDDDVRYLRRVDAGRCETVGELSGGRHEVGAGADVEDREPVARPDQRHVAVGSQRVRRHAGVGEEPREFFLRHIGEDEPHRQCQRAVADDGQFGAARRNRLRARLPQPARHEPGQETRRAQSHDHRTSRDHKAAFAISHHSNFSHSHILFFAYFVVAD